MLHIVIQKFVLFLSILNGIVFAVPTQNVSSKETAAERIPIYLSEDTLSHLGGAKTDADLNKFVKENMHRKVRSVWLTKIPAVGKKAKLGMHHHEYDRLLLALNSGQLEVNYGKMENKKFIELPAKQKKYDFTEDNVYFLERDAPSLMHNDVNVSGHTFNAVVVELE